VGIRAGILAEEEIHNFRSTKKTGATKQERVYSLKNEKVALRIGIGGRQTESKRKDKGKIKDQRANKEIGQLDKNERRGNSENGRCWEEGQVLRIYHCNLRSLQSRRKGRGGGQTYLVHTLERWGGGWKGIQFLKVKWPMQASRTRLDELRERGEEGGHKRHS